MKSTKGMHCFRSGIPETFLTGRCVKTRVRFLNIIFLRIMKLSLIQRCFRECRRNWKEENLGMENDKKLRVAVYVRVSEETKETQHSLHAQEEFYRRQIHYIRNPCESRWDGRKYRAWRILRKNDLRSTRQWKKHKRNEYEAKRISITSWLVFFFDLNQILNKVWKMLTNIMQVYILSII